MTSWADLFDASSVVIDGGMSTQLARTGYDTSGPLWTGNALLHKPSGVVQAHRDFVEAGCNVVITCSYQISRQGFRRIGLTDLDADLAMSAATHAAREAVEGTSVRVAASVGPYGAVLHDGSEYRGNYGLAASQLYDFHAERIDTIIASEPDLLAVETIPDAREAEVLADVLSTRSTMPAWMTFTCSDSERLWAGQSIEEAVAIASSVPSIIGVGINCTDPLLISDLLARMRAVTALPLVVYPNAGGTWVSSSETWQGGGEDFTALAPSWRAIGATAIGGCCGTGASEIAALVALLR